MNHRKINQVQQEDIQRVVHSSWIPWERFRGKTIAVTGAAGLIGRNLIDTLLEADQTYDLGCQVLALVRNTEKAKKIFGEQKNLRILKQDVLDPVPSEIHADFLVHAASVTASKVMVEQPVETIMTTVEGTHQMLEFAVRCKMEGVVYVSSMEAYGMVTSESGELKEEDLGWIDLTNVRNGYAEGKRLAECLCASYAKEYGVHVRAARLAQTFGAGISKEENRVFAQFARSILNGEDIVLHTKGEKANCYCYISDAVSGILMLLLSGEDGQSYNVANMETFCSIRGLAETFLKLDKTGSCRLRIEIPEDSAALGYAPDTILRLNSKKLMKLGWKPEKNLEEMADRLLMSLEQDYKEAGYL